MRSLRCLRSISLTLPLLLAAGAASAVPLDIVEVGAPAINCVFDTDCRITVQDFVKTFSVPAASGDGRLQSRNQPPGEAGTAGVGLYAYEYRVDLTQVGALTAQICVDELRVDFGPVESLDYDGDGRPEQVYVVTRGGLGSVRPSSAEQSAGVVTFHFQPAVCPGNRVGAGETSFFFGLASKQPPRTISADLGFTAGSDITIDVKAPEAPPHAPPGRSSGGCEVGVRPQGPFNVPIPRWTPACRCLQDAGLREFRCALVHPDLIVVWHGPFPTPPFDPFQLHWTLISASDHGGGKLKVNPPEAFQVIGRGGATIELPADSARNATAAGSVWLVPMKASTGERRLSVDLTLPKRANQPATELEISFPMSVSGQGTP